MKLAIAPASDSGSQGLENSGAPLIGSNRDDKRIVGMQQGFSDRVTIDLDLRVVMVFETLDDHQIDRAIRSSNSSSEGSAAPRSSCISAQRCPEATITSRAPACR